MVIPYNQSPKIPLEKKKKPLTQGEIRGWWDKDRVERVEYFFTKSAKSLF